MDHFALHGGSPGEDPPWYFITRDFAKSIGSSVALLLSLVVAAFTWRWWPTYSSMMVWMSVLWQGGDIAQGWIIYRSCPGLLDGQRNTSRWSTFKSYLYDAEIDQVRTYVLAGALLLSFTLPLADRYIRRKLKSKNATGSGTGSGNDFRIGISRIFASYGGRTGDFMAPPRGDLRRVAVAWAVKTSRRRSGNSSHGQARNFHPKSIKGSVLDIDM